MEQGNGLGPWESILEFLAYSTVISNCLFIYWFKDLYAETLHESIKLNLNYRRDFKYENMELLSSVLEQIKMAGVNATVGFENEHLTTI